MNECNHYHMKPAVIHVHLHILTFAFYFSSFRIKCAYLNKSNGRYCKYTYLCMQFYLFLPLAFCISRKSIKFNENKNTTKSKLIFKIDRFNCKKRKKKIIENRCTWRNKFVIAIRLKEKHSSTCNHV